MSCGQCLQEEQWQWKREERGPRPLESICAPSLFSCTVATTRFGNQSRLRCSVVLVLAFNFPSKNSRNHSMQHKHVGETCRQVFICSFHVDFHHHKPAASADLRLKCTHWAQLQSWLGLLSSGAQGRMHLPVFSSIQQPSLCPGPCPFHLLSQQLLPSPVSTVQSLSQIISLVLTLLPPLLMFKGPVGYAGSTKVLQSHLPISRSADSQILILSCHVAFTHGSWVGCGSLGIMILSTRFPIRSFRKIHARYFHSPASPSGICSKTPVHA